MSEKKDCPVESGECFLQSESGCSFKHECQLMKEDHDRHLIRRLRDLEGLIRYYEAAEGEWSRETEARNRAYKDYSLIRDECVKKGLKID